ncbi:phosphoribosylformylglycinamidine synthase subunit PurS [Sulfobacillus harzensis]|uniref:Phosphoribosylformylglycinamidine synthase subunit PurS n=1 Tax=Sulfobacillus harzensis TaxID=2729629 RepID=A0A7Y0Q3V2_9FIRM|nr:phosphoribosylformylglycinamidine synthase subunit PurS [Sulfobacillus harzensis]NMP23927.1 phosphoribosylformylglycinamidine synthase subunit PurS [Sulfobacillus harzensis]
MQSFRAVVTVRLKDSILDPAGEATEGVLKHMGFAVQGVRIGRHIQVTLEAEDAKAARRAVERMAHDLLANPVMEDYDVEVLS